MPSSPRTWIRIAFCTSCPLGPVVLSLRWMVATPGMPMVAGPAGYRGWDLFRIGLPLSLVYIVVATAMVNWVF